MKIAIVGLGGTGSAALRFLAMAGHTVTGYERFKIGHRRGSSHGNSRIIRYAYPDPLYASLMTMAFPLWESLCTHTQRDLMVKCGGITFAPNGHPELTATTHALATAGVSFEALMAQEAMHRFPAFKFASDEVVIHHTDAGFLRSSDIVETNIALAADAGASVLAEASVVDIQDTPGGVVVTTEYGDVRTYDKVIVAGGAYLTMLFHQIGLPLTVTRQQVTYVRVDQDALRNCTAERMPVWIDAESYWYGIPLDGRCDGVKLARHYQGDVVNPMLDDRVVRSDDDSAAVRVAEKRILGVTSDVVHSEVCLYTNTPNEDFLFDVLPGSDDVLLVSGCSGHGFKFTILLGQAAADWATRDVLELGGARFRLTDL